MFNAPQEAAIIHLVLASKAIRLREIQSHIITGGTTFNNIWQGSLSTLARILRGNQVDTKQHCRGAF